MSLQFVKRSLAESACWRIYHPQESDVVEGVHRQFQIRDDVLDLGPLVE